MVLGRAHMESKIPAIPNLTDLYIYLLSNLLMDIFAKKFGSFQRIGVQLTP